MNDGDLVLDLYVDGIVERCKQANLSPEHELAVYNLVVHTAIENAKTTTKSAETPISAAPSVLSSSVDVMKDKMKDTIQGARDFMSTPGGAALGGGLGLAALSVPLTAMFGSRDEKGKKKYLRNALIAGLGGALLPGFIRGFRSGMGTTNAENPSVPDASK